MTLMNWLRHSFTRKESQARIAVAVNKLGKPIMTPANYEGFARGGYGKNAVVYSCITKISQSGAGVNWGLFKRQGKNLTELEDHPILKLWDKPNPLQAQASFIEAALAYRLISGNSYIEANVIKGAPVELWPVRPDKMKVQTNSMGYVSKYHFKYGQVERSWDVDQVNMKSPILHWKSFNPNDDFYGMSPIQAALLQIDQSNAGQKWNLSLLQNQAAPSGVLQMDSTKSNPRGTLTDEQYTKLKSEFDEWYTGPRNAGRPMILEGGLVWQQIALSPKDMDFIKSKEVTATDIATVFGVPPEIIGIGAKTFNNYREARLAFYEETVLPLLDSFRDSMNMWLSYYWGDDVFLEYDKDDIEALQLRREQKITSLTGANFLTINEKREALGYDKLDDGDTLVGAGPAPIEEDETGDDNEEDEIEDIEDDNNNNDDDNIDDDNDDTSKSFKSINLLTGNEKRRSWKRQNQLRKRLEISFNRELKNDFNDLTKSLVETAERMKGAEKSLLEFALLKASYEEEKNFQRTISRHLKYSLEEFGLPLLGQAKSMGLGIEQKANLKFDAFVNRYIEQYTGTQIKTIFGTNEKTIRKIVKEWTLEASRAGDSIPELSKYLNAEFEGLSEGRARTIARTEVSRASTNGSLAAAKSLNIPTLKKEWVTANDGRTRNGSEGSGADHASMNGVQIEIDEKFNVPPGATMDGPGDTAAEAGQVINCRCVLVYRNKGGK